MTIRASTTRHPALTYYALVFAISWGGVLIVVGPSGFPGTREEVEKLMPYVILAFAIGPALPGPLFGFISGRAGLREFLSRFVGQQGCRS
jgi:CAAX protease family protein